MLESLFFQLFQLGQVLFHRLQIDERNLFYPVFLLRRDVFLGCQEGGLNRLGLLLHGLVWRLEQPLLVMPYLHFFVQLFSIDSLVDLQVLESVEVKVGEQAAALDLLLVELAEVGDRRVAAEAALDLRSGGLRVLL